MLTEFKQVQTIKPFHSQSYGFSSSHARMSEMDHKEGWVPKGRCFQTVVLEKTLESPLDSRELKPVHPKGNQSWIFISSIDAEAPIFWQPDAKSWVIGRDPDAGKARGEGVNKRQDGWMASLTQWIWVWANSGRWWRAGKPGVQSMGSQRVGHNLVTKQQKQNILLSNLSF